MRKVPVIRENFCKNCGICESFCPKDVFATNDKKIVFVETPEDCISCMMCEMRCPHLAIQFVEVE